MGHDFASKAARVLNSRQTSSLILTGNILDLFHAPDNSGPGAYLPLIDYLSSKWESNKLIAIIYELNGPIRFLSDKDRDEVKDAWLKWKTGLSQSQLAIQQLTRKSKLVDQAQLLAKDFDKNLMEAIGKPSMAMEILRQLCLCSRSKLGNESILKKNLIILIEGADLLIPTGEISRLSDADRLRINICRDWFSDPGFTRGRDAVILIAESRSSINQRVAELPSIIDIQVALPDEEVRGHFIKWFRKTEPDSKHLKLWGKDQELVQASAGLSVHALYQLLLGATYDKKQLDPADVIAKVEAHIESQLGDGVVEFKKPGHTLKDVVGFSVIKKFLADELIPRLKSKDADALPGAGVGGPIGSGKTFIFEAVAAELGIPVLVLKNLRSKWFGETDMIFERLRRVIEALDRVLIFVDEADTQFGGVGAETHATERRLTGKIQAMMSDPLLRGKVSWLLMTARIHLLSPDIRRPGRVGDLIIPILDPEGEDRNEFIKWMVAGVFEKNGEAEILEQIDKHTQGYSAASFASLRSELLAKAGEHKLDLEKALAIIKDRIPPAIDETRQYQKLQALLNCTRRSLLPESDEDFGKRRQVWLKEIQQLEQLGIH